MKTINDLLKEIAKKAIKESKGERCNNIFYDLIETKYMFFGERDTKLEANHLNASFSEDIYSLIKKLPKLTEGYYFPDRKETLQFLGIQHFLEADDVTKEKLINIPSICQNILEIPECFHKFIPPKWYKKICNNPNCESDEEDYDIDDGPDDDSHTMWKLLLSIEDFDNVTDDELKELINGCYYKHASAYTFCCRLFGKERTIPLIIESIQKHTSKVKDIDLLLTNQDDDIIEEIILNLNENIIKDIDFSELSDSLYYKLCKKDSKYLSYGKFLAYTSNIIWDNTEKYSDIFRYCAVIAQCCEKAQIPKYRLKDLGAFAGVIKLYDYKYNEVFNVIRDSFNPNGSIKDNVVVLGEPNAGNIYYCVIKDDNIQIFKTEQERAKANVKGGINYNFTKTQLNRKIAKLLY